jgi:zinc D-Ala-D-Ala carboxypeptidase
VVKAPTRVLFIVAFALVSVSIGSLAEVGSVSAANPLVSASKSTPPKCTYRDVRTGQTAYSRYATTLLDTIYRLPSSYRPRDLRATGLRGGGSVRGVALRDLRAMDRAARSAGARFAVQSAFRSYSTQVSTFAYWVRVAGRKAALKASARPGHSEHQLGTAIDFRSYNGGAPWSGDWARTRAGAWMKKNAWKYGWVSSYPKGKSAMTCYQYEPWHYRYVGRAKAERIHASGLTTRQWIWTKYGNRSKA